MWCTTTTSTCSSRRRVEQLGAHGRLAGGRSKPSLATAASAAASSCSATCGQAPGRSRPPAWQHDLLTATPSTSGKTVRRLSCRATTSPSACVQRVRSSAPRSRISERDVVGGRAAVEAVEEPQPLLGGRQRHRLGALPAHAAPAGPGPSPRPARRPARRRSGPRTPPGTGEFARRVAARIRATRRVASECCRRGRRSRRRCRPASRPSTSAKTPPRSAPRRARRR